MPVYHYEGLYANGEKVNGVVEAVNKEAAIAQIRQSCEAVLSLQEARSTVRDPFRNFRKVDAKTLALVCRQFSILLKAGLPLVQTVDLTAGQTGDKAFKELLRQVSEDISNGWSLSYSFAQKGQGKLPVTFIETVRSGEESGDLVTVFERMSSYYERMNKTRTKAASALIYPAFVIAAAVIVAAVIMLFAVPTLTGTFSSMGIELPGVTRALIGISGFVKRYGCAVLVALAAIVLIIRLYGLTADGGERLARWKLALPIVGKIGVMAGASQFCHTMETMLSAGMPILQALEVSGRSIGNACLAKAVLDTIPGVESGRSLGECMSQNPELPDLLVQMTAAGETTGSMEGTLAVLAEYYDNEVDVRTARALSLLEPFIICMLAGFVVFILLAVYLPMLSMYSAI